MRKILLINPDSSEATTAMMVVIASKGLPAGTRVERATARRGPAMIVNAIGLEGRFHIPVIAPISAAVRRVLALLDAGAALPHGA